MSKMTKFKVFYRLKKTNGRASFKFSDFWMPLCQALAVYDDDGATRGASACAARATP
jgi:hypothetical protein